MLQSSHGREECHPAGVRNHSHSRFSARGACLDELLCHLGLAKGSRARLRQRSEAARRGSPKVGKRKCKVLDGWEELGEAIRDEGIKKNESILVIEGAHGGPGGLATCNSGDVEGSRIFRNPPRPLRKVPRRSRDLVLLLAIHGCKLLHDQKEALEHPNTDGPSIDRLSWPRIHFGRVRADPRRICSRS